MRSPHADFIKHIRATSAPRTAETYAAIISAFFVFTEAEAMSVPLCSEVEAFLARPLANGSRRAVATRNQELAALRAFARFGREKLGWTENPTDGIPFLREPARAPPVLSVGELRHLFTVAAERARGATRSRNLAMLAVLSQAGLRVHELVALDATQVDLPSATIVGVHGKGDTIHDLPINAPTVGLLAAWLGERTEIMADDEQALFVSRAGRRISKRTVQRLLVQLRASMGTAKQVTPHTLRHTTATLALTLGADLSTVGDLLRHADLNTTRRYLHLVDERRREAVRRLGTAIPENLVVPGTGGEKTQPANEKTANFPEVGGQDGKGAEELDAQYDLDDVAA